MLLVAVAIVMILYMVDMTTIFGLGSRTRPLERPLWQEENRIVGPDILIKLPKAPKPLLDNPVSLTAAVTRNDNLRGNINVEFNTIGEVAGKWNASYERDGKEYTFDAKFTGNIDVSKTYSEGKKTDKSRLYFITKGNYTQRVFNKKNKDLSTTQGIIYVAGWLRPDYSADGKLVITAQDKTWSVEYLWQSRK